ncbi:MAG: signal recognition particle-docking protein FtsY [Crenarchaeota archaeon]|nr:signal recognition particle-docking protein FtsY [Thermoproteota archaeon]
MFSKIKSIFKKFVDSVSETLKYKTLSQEELRNLLEDLELKLLEADVAYDVAEKLREQLESALSNLKIPRGSDARKHVESIIREKLLEILERGRFAEDLVELVRKSEEKPFRIVFMGVNGVGKTTTIAKVANLLKKHGIKSVIVAADTFRAAAQEQLRKHSENLGLPFVGGKYGSDPAAVAYDGVSYAKKRGYPAVLIDTAGRMHVDADLMNELRKVVRVVKPNLRVLVLDALTGNDAVEQAKAFHESVGVDCVILTKVDADSRGGAALSVILSIERPIAYLGIGQGYDDLVPYDPKYILKLIFGE